jgi:hypothetical protein
MDKLSIIFSITFLLFTYGQDVQPQSGYDPNWFTPDIVTTKHDPYDLISSNFGQPSGQYNWNVDQFQLMVSFFKLNLNLNGITESNKKNL